MKLVLASCVVAGMCVSHCFAADSTAGDTAESLKNAKTESSVVAHKDGAKKHAKSAATAVSGTEGASAKDSAVAAESAPGKESVQKQESWIGTFSKKDDENVEFVAGGKTYEVTGAIEKELLKEVGKEMKVTGSIDTEGALKVAKAEPVKVVK